MRSGRKENHFIVIINLYHNLELKNLSSEMYVVKEQQQCYNILKHLPLYEKHLKQFPWEWKVHKKIFQHISGSMLVGFSLTNNTQTTHMMWKIFMVCFLLELHQLSIFYVFTHFMLFACCLGILRQASVELRFKLPWRIMQCFVLYFWCFNTFKVMYIYKS